MYSRHPRRFYIVNTGVSTVRALQPAAWTLASEGVLVRYTRPNARLEPATKGYTEQPGGTHADEVETSMMLYIDPAAVAISKAVKDFKPSSGASKLTRQRGANGTPAHPDHGAMRQRGCRRCPAAKACRVMTHSGTPYAVISIGKCSPCGGA